MKTLLGKIKNHEVITANDAIHEVDRLKVVYEGSQYKNLVKKIENEKN